MKVLVGYNGSKASRRALDEARGYAKAFDALVYIVNSVEGGSGETSDDIIRANEMLDEAKSLMESEGVSYDVSQLARGMSPGADIIDFATENDIDHIFLGIEKLSRVGKLLLGSTAQYIILKAPCPVTTVRP